MLHREVIPDCTRAVPDETECLGETASGEKVMKEIVESSLYVRYVSAEMQADTEPDL
jgi:hypothetical protein